MNLTAKNAIKLIDAHGMLLVYPMAGKADPASLWSVAYPRSKMRWEWSDTGDGRVARLWHLREELSRSKKVVYAKWYRGRATFFSKEIFSALLSLFLKSGGQLSRDARALLTILEESSPRSTKELKRESGLQGRFLESTYTKAMKELWERLLIVGFGEVDDGAFPSLAVGATRLLFEPLYLEAEELSAGEAETRLLPLMRASPELTRFLDRAMRPRRSPTP